MKPDLININLYSHSTIQSERLKGDNLSWEKTIVGIERLMRQISLHTPKFFPDIIIGINQGGLILASLYNKYLNNPLYYFKIEDTGDGKIKMIRYTNLPNGEDFSTKRVLIFDETLKRGRSLNCLFKYLKLSNINPKSVHIAVLVLADIENVDNYDKRHPFQYNNLNGDLVTIISDLGQLNYIGFISENKSIRYPWYRLI